ncbi:general transcription factor IIE subunit 2-like [Styela clava]
MDASLLRQREEFNKRALARPVIEKRKHQSEAVNNDTSAASAKKKPKKLQRPTSDSNSVKSISSYSSRAGIGGSKFGNLAQIVNFMKSRHQEDDMFPLTIDEILEECKLEDIITPVQKNWLINEALPNNPKIQVVDNPGQERKYAFKPKYNIRDKKSLLKLLDRYDQRGLGGIMRFEVEESLPNAKRCLKALGNKIIYITRPDKKEVLFYNDKSCEFQVDEEFQKLWRSVAIESMDETKIEEYLNQQGMSSVQDTRTKLKPAQPRKRANNRKRKFKRHNDHIIAGVLEDYSEKQK